MLSNCTVWQIADSAFPAGAFAHSGGLEAAWQCGEVEGARGLASWTEATLRQAAAAALPVVAAAWEAPDSLAELDARWDAFLLNHVANRASRAQGQAFLMACAKTFDEDAVRRLAASVRRQQSAGHWAPVLGAVCRTLGVPRRQACELLLFLTLRGCVSGAVRLGVVGPLEGQRLQHRMAAPLHALLDAHAYAPLDAVAQVAPLADLFQGLHDRLYSRLFVS